MLRYKKASIWIFVILLLLVVFMFIFPTSLVIGAGLILLPLLVALQTYVILKAKEQSGKTFQDRWYDKP